MKIDNITILYSFVGLTGIASVIFLTLLLYKHGANIELSTLAQIAILVQIPIAVVATIATIVKKKDGENDIDDIGKPNKNNKNRHDNK